MSSKRTSGESARFHLSEYGVYEELTPFSRGQLEFVAANPGPAYRMTWSTNSIWMSVARYCEDLEVEFSSAPVFRGAYLHRNQPGNKHCQVELPRQRLCRTKSMRERVYRHDSRVADCC